MITTIHFINSAHQANIIEIDISNKKIATTTYIREQSTRNNHHSNKQINEIIVILDIQYHRLHTEEVNEQKKSVKNWKKIIQYTIKIHQIKQHLIQFLK